MKTRLRPVTTVGILLYALCPAVSAGWTDDIGYMALRTRLGAATPTGLGIDVSQVEATSDGAYMPDISNPTYAPEFAGKTIIAKSGASAPSSHATTVGLYYYGRVTGIATDIDPIDVYEANSWLNGGMLRAGTAFAPLTETRRAENHSWIGSLGTDALDADALRRLDLVAQRDGVVFAVGVNNGAGSAMPHLLCSAYNALAVGLTSGGSSYGPTTVDVAGRVKPDIVVPMSLTSWATPVVASSASLLLQTADADGILGQLAAQERKTAKALLVRALLMAGATKAEFADWRKGFATPSTDGTVPLDFRFGAGELNIDNSHRILTAGQQNPGISADVATTGWDYDTAAPASDRRYFFEIPAFRYADTVSILVAWNRQITVGGGNPARLTPSLANIDLRLYAASGYTVGAVWDQSISAIDNVEHIYLRWLPAGRYAIAVVSDKTWSYALAWDIHTSPTVAEDFDGDGDVDLGDFAFMQSCFNGPNRPPQSGGCERADLDGDSDVDLADFGGFQFCFNGPNRPPRCL
ncbi:MAG: dockerin type I domain-containing protein [Phycisphaerae bacterium]